MGQGKVQSLPPMPFGEEGLFGLDYSLHPSFFQVISGCLRCEGVVGDFLKDLGDLGGILSLPGGDEMLGIASIRLRKLRRTSSRDFLLVRAMLPLQPRDGCVV
jgi:hypothetical protein